MKKHSAIFLDRDGTLINDNGYIDKISLIDFYPFTIDALKKIQEYFYLFIITNQSGISKGVTSERNVKLVNEFIEDHLKKNNINIQKTYYCPHQDNDNCNCKKPNPYFIHLAADVYNLDLAKSFIIGDHPSDVYCGINAGVSPVYILTGHGKKHQNELKHNVQVCSNIMEASNFILSTIKHKKQKQ